VVFFIEEIPLFLLYKILPAKESGKIAKGLNHSGYACKEKDSHI